MVITGMNSFGAQVHVEKRFYWLCMEHQKAVITLAAFLTSLVSAELPTVMKKTDVWNFLIISPQLNSKGFRGMRNSEKIRRIYFLSIPKTARMRKFLQQLLHKHSRNTLTVPCLQLACAAGDIPIFWNACFPFQLFMYSKSLLHYCHCT